MLINLRNGGKEGNFFFICKFLVGNKFSTVSREEKKKLLTAALSSPSLGSSACNLWLSYASSRLTCLCPDGGSRFILTSVFLLSVSAAGFFGRVQRLGDVFIAAR